MKMNHGFTPNKTKNHGYCTMLSKNEPWFCYTNHTNHSLTVAFCSKTVVMVSNPSKKKKKGYYTFTIIKPW